MADVEQSVLVRAGEVGAVTELGDFGVLKQVKAGELNIGYVENGPADGPVVICLHGFPVGRGVAAAVVVIAPPSDTAAAPTPTAFAKPRR